jgi:chromosome segregation ATPase
VILEEMRSENRATLEAVVAFRSSLEARIERLDYESRDRDAALSLALGELRREVREHSKDLTELKRLSLRLGADSDGLKELGLQHSAIITENSGDIRELKGDIRELKGIVYELGIGVRENTVELRSLSHALNRLDARVAGLEERVASGGSTPPPA